VQKKARYRILKTLTLVGCFSTGIIYVSIGVIAILSFLKLKNGGADESSFFVLLNGFVAGRIVNWAIVIGAICFIIWRFYEAIKDPHHRGNDAKAILLRAGGGFSSAADAFIAVSALSVMFGSSNIPVSGEPIQQRHVVDRLLQVNGGPAIITAAGVIVLITSIVLLFYSFSSRFTEAIRSKDFSRKQKVAVHAIAYAGYFARGVILSIIGFFYIKSAIEHNGRYVVNTDKAFDFIGDHIGHPWFILIAVATVSYGVYMFILGLHYDIA
jgi:uncharacterized membrane protein